MVNKIGQQENWFPLQKFFCGARGRGVPYSNPRSKISPNSCLYWTSSWFDSFLLHNIIAWSYSWLHSGVFCRHDLQYSVKRDYKGIDVQEWVLGNSEILYKRKRQSFPFLSELFTPTLLPTTARSTHFQRGTHASKHKRISIHSNICPATAAVCVCVCVCVCICSSITCQQTLDLIFLHHIVQY